MAYIWIGNVLALMASLLMVYSGVLKEKKKILHIQTIQIGLFVISNIVLGGITGAIMNIISCIRNILCYKEKLGVKEKIIITIGSILVSLKFNNLGLIGLLPLISTVSYLWIMDTKNIIKFKVLLMFTMLLWFIYDIYIKSYTSSVFDLASIIANSISIFNIIKSGKNPMNK